MTALPESIRYGIKKQRQHAIAALKKDDLATFAEILGELRTAQLSAENAIEDLTRRFNARRTDGRHPNAARNRTVLYFEGEEYEFLPVPDDAIPVEIPNRDGDPAAVPA